MTNRTKIVYHEALPDTYGLKYNYNDAMRVAGECIGMHQKYLFKITDFLMSEKPIKGSVFGE